MSHSWQLRWIAVCAVAAAVGCGDGGSTRAVKLAMGWQKTCALMDDGSARCRGEGEEGKSRRVAEEASVDVLALTGFTCLRAEGGALRCRYDFADDPEKAWAPVAGFEGGGPLKTNGDTACALFTGGRVRCLRLSDTATLSEAVVEVADVVVLPGTEEIFLGSGQLAVRRGNGSILGWGFDTTPSGVANIGIPLKIDGPFKEFSQLQGARALAFGCVFFAGFGVVLDPDATLRSWGSFMATLSGHTETAEVKPLSKVGSIASVAQIAAGSAHVCALRKDGRVVCWGDNAFGQLGDGTLVGRETPMEVAGLPEVGEVGATYAQSCALTTAGEVYCWGYGEDGQLGQGTLANSAVPVRVDFSP